MGAPLTESMFYILLSVLKPNHGYGIMQEVEERTKGRVVLGAGTLYGVLNSLLEKKWIMLHSQDDQSRKKKEYLITTLGKEVLNEEIARLGELLENGRKAMRNDEKI